MPGKVAFPSRDYDPEELLSLLRDFESALVEKSFPTVQAYANAIDDFVHRHVVPDLEPFFRNMTQSVQMLFDQSTGSLVGVHEGLRAVVDHLARVSGKMQDYFLPFLQEGSFLVHGDSQLLAAVLEDALLQSKNVDILILEGLPQRSGQKLLERVENSALVRNNPELKKRLLLAPDSSALRLLQRTKCNFVLFGAHAVTPHGCLIASAGSLQLATLAQECNVSVYSLAPTFKFAMSLSSMPFSSDDLVVLGSTLTASQQQQQQQQQQQMSRCASAAGAPLLTVAESAVGGARRGSGSSGSSPPHGPASPHGKGTTSQPTSTDLGPANAPIANASFSRAPPSLQISPQLKAVQPPTALEAALASPAAATMAAHRSNSNSTPTAHFDGSAPTVVVSSAGGAASPFDAQHLVQPSATGVPPALPLARPVPSLAGTATGAAAGGAGITSTSAPSSLPLTPQLRAAGSSGIGLEPLVPAVHVAGSAAVFGSAAASSVAATSNSRNGGGGAGAAAASAGFATPQQVLSEFYYSPTCASQLDLVGSSLITHFFTEHGVVMPWSVADKISKIFLKEIRNKRLSSKAARGH